jgi:hypothetical protein
MRFRMPALLRRLFYRDHPEPDRTEARDAEAQVRRDLEERQQRLRLLEYDVEAHGRRYVFDRRRRADHGGH